MKALAICTIALNISLGASAQQLLSHRGLAHEPVVIVNPTTGGLTPFGPAVQQVGPITTFDQVHRRLFYATNRILFVVDFTRQTTRIVSASAFDYASIEYDPVTDRVLAALSSFPVQVIAIDPSTGNTTPIANFSTTAVRNGVIALDATGRRLFLLTGALLPTAITTINLATGSVSVTPLGPSGYFFFQYDPMTAKLLSLTPNGVQLNFVAIDPATGAEAVLFSTDASALGGPDTSVSAYDPMTRRIFLTDIDTDVFLFQGRIITVDLANQTIERHYTGEVKFGAGALEFLEFATITDTVPAMQFFVASMLVVVLAIIGIRAATG